MKSALPAERGGRRWLLREVVTLGLVGWSLVVLGAAWWLDLRFLPDGYRGFWEQPNWALFPLFFLVLHVLVCCSWEPFLRSWDELCWNGCVRHGSEPGSSTTEEHRIGIRSQLMAWRQAVFVLAGVLTVAVSLLSGDLRDVYRTDQEVLRDESKAAAFFDAHWSTAWFQAHLEVGPPKGPETRVLEKDWSVAFLIERSTGEAWISRPANGLFVLAAYSLQFAGIWYGWFGLGQILLHTFAFWFFERTAVARRFGLELRLDARSKLREFGLESWNQALNNLYWVLCLALFIPLLSKVSQSRNPDSGQELLRYLVPAIILLPMLLTIVARQQRVPAVWREVRGLGQEELDAFHAQKLWPLDRNWASKLGIVIAFFVLSLLLGFGVASALGFGG